MHFAVLVGVGGGGLDQEHRPGAALLLGEVGDEGRCGDGVAGAHRIAEADIVARHEAVFYGQVEFYFAGFAAPSVFADAAAMMKGGQKQERRQQRAIVVVADVGVADGFVIAQDIVRAYECGFGVPHRFAYERADLWCEQNKFRHGEGFRKISRLPACADADAARGNVR